jgi:hypothetical protein
MFIDLKYSTYISVWPSNGYWLLKTPLIYLVIPNTWTWTWSVNPNKSSLIPMTSEVVRYKIKNFITWTSTWKICLKNPGRSVRNELHTTGSSVRGRQVPLVEVWQLKRFRVHESGFLQRLTMRSKEWKNINTHPIVYRSSLCLYIGLAIEFFQNFIYQLVLDF